MASCARARARTDQTPPVSRASSKRRRATSGGRHGRCRQETGGSRAADGAPPPQQGCFRFAQTAINFFSNRPRNRGNAPGLIGMCAAHPHIPVAKIARGHTYTSPVSGFSTFRNSSWEQGPEPAVDLAEQLQPSLHLPRNRAFVDPPLHRDMRLRLALQVTFLRIRAVVVHLRRSMSTWWVSWPSIRFE